MDNNTSLWSLFGIFSKIGAFTIGGGYAMIPLIEHEITKRGWMQQEQMDDVIVLAQSAPGLLAVNMAIFTGYRLRGIKGSIVATLGAVLPSFLIILLVASVLSSFKDNPYVVKFFNGVRPASVALILVPAIRLGSKCKDKWWAWLLCFGTMLSVSIMEISPVWILLVVIICTISISLLKEGRRK